jgi:hypothetical protein
MIFSRRTEMIYRLPTSLHASTGENGPSDQEGNLDQDNTAHHIGGENLGTFTAFPGQRALEQIR